jgi:capsular exopolysaccharide synthesis family protein
VNDHQASSLRHYLTVLRRRGALIAAFAIVVPALAVGYALTQEHRYSASSQVLVNRQSVASQLANTSDIGQQQQSFQQVLMTQAKLARTFTVLRATLSRSGDAGVGLTPQQLRDDSTAAPNPDSDLLTFTVVRPTVRDAKRLAISYANAYVAYRRTLDGAALSRALADVNQAISEARGRGRAAEGLITSLERNRQQLETRLALQTQNAQVVSGPDEATQVQPRPLRNGILGLVIGLVVGLTVALLRDLLDTRVRSSSDLEQMLGLPILSRIPRPRGPGRGEPASLVMRSSPGAPVAESFRILRTNLSFGLMSHKATVVMVSSAAQGEGKSTTIANLAVAEAISGKRVVLVDLDLRRPKVATLFEVAGHQGVTSVAVGDATLDKALVHVDLPATTGVASAARVADLQILAAGPLPPDPAEFVDTAVVRSIISDLTERFDLVLIDAPPLIGVSDASVIAAYADAVFLCSRLGVVRQPLLRELSRAIGSIAAPVLGVVVTGAEADDEADYTGYYGYGGSATYAPESSTPKDLEPAGS